MATDAHPEGEDEMAKDATTRRGRRLRGPVSLLLVLLLAAGGAAVWRYDLLDGRLGDLVGGGPDSSSTPGADGSTGPDADPASVAPPPGIDLPEVTAPAPVADPAPGGDLDPAAVRRALRPLLTDKVLGKHVLAAVAPLGGGAPVYALGTGTALPASTTKLVTSTAALLALGPDHVFTTKVVAAPGKPKDGVRRLVLVGGGDPFLERGPTQPPAADGSAAPWPYPVRADLATLADRTARALRKAGVGAVSVGYDTSLFPGPAANPTWEADYVPDAVVSPTWSLWVDEGRPPNRYGRVADAPSDAAAAFVAALTRAGIEVVGPAAATTAPRAATDVASVESAPLSRIVERILDVSDNEGAEVLLRQVGLATSGTGSIAAGTAGVRRTLEDAGLRFGASVFRDGSGLSRADRAEPRLLLDVLRLAASPDHPELRSVVTGLPVAGFTGSLADRMDHGDPAGLGRVRAKTGTLESVSTLAGVATGLDGTPMVFALMIDRVPYADTTLAKVTLDDAAAALGACRCGG